MAGNDGRGSHSVPAMGLMHLDHFQPGSQQILLATRPSPSSHTAAFAPGRSFALSGASKLFAVTPAILAAARFPPALAVCSPPTPLSVRSRSSGSPRGLLMCPECPRI